MSEPQAPAGWFRHGELEWWWDGSRWTGETRSSEPLAGDDDRPWGERRMEARRAAKGLPTGPSYPRMAKNDPSRLRLAVVSFAVVGVIAAAALVAGFTGQREVWLWIEVPVPAEAPVQTFESCRHFYTETGDIAEAIIGARVFVYDDEGNTLAEQEIEEGGDVLGDPFHEDGHVDGCEWNLDYIDAPKSSSYSAEIVLADGSSFETEIPSSRWGSDEARGRITVELMYGTPP